MKCVGALCLGGVGVGLFCGALGVGDVGVDATGEHPEDTAVADDEDEEGHEELDGDEEDTHPNTP